MCMKDRKQWTFWKILLLAVCVLFAVKFIFDFNGFWQLFSAIGGSNISVLSYILIGFIIAYVLDAYIHFLSDKVLRFWKKRPRLKRNLCIIIGYATFAGVLTFFVFTLVPYLTDSVKSLIKEFPNYIDQFKSLYAKLLDGTLIALPEEAINTIDGAIRDTFTAFLKFIDVSKISSFVTTTTVTVFNIIMGLMVSVYMLLEKEDVLRAANKITDGLFTKKTARRIKWAGRKVNEIFRRYFTGKLIQAIVVSLLAFIVFSIARIPYAMLFAVVVGVFNMVPYIGPWAGAAPVILVSLVSGFWTGVAATVCIIIVQVFDNVIISPRILGDQMGISPLAVLIGLCIGGKLFGIAGLIMGNVLAALVKVFFYDTYLEAIRRKKVRERIAQKRQKSLTGNTAGESSKEEENGADSISLASEVDPDEDLFGGEPHDAVAEESAKERKEELLRHAVNTPQKTKKNRK